MSIAAQKRLLKRWIILADKTLSRRTRRVTRLEYGLCPFCKAKPIKHCFHFVTRRKWAARWDSRNVIGSCASCNYNERYYSDKYRAWHIRKYGVEQYLSVCDLAESTIELSVPYLKEIVKKLNARKAPKTRTPISGS